jgi:dihydrofolate synthase/folylpolyglutamate synthase
MPLMSPATLPLPDWLARLEILSPREIDLGLDRVDQVLERLALPRPKNVFHVAGTNGKGSCVAMLEALLLHDEACVGSYTSPHMIRYNERIRINGGEASDEQIVAAFERIEALRGSMPLTYFEYGTLAALVVFADANVDTAILEVGMGGRLDAVNAVEPDAGIITNISLDHCDWLGEDTESIAVEKAGIMRRDKPVVFGSRKMPRTIAERAKATRARLLVAGRDYDWLHGSDGWMWSDSQQRLEGLKMPALPGDHQLENAAAVLAMLKAAGRHDLLHADKVNDALSGLRLAGRMQRIEGTNQYLLDVAHNAAAAAALATVLESEPIDGQTVAIIGVLNDKDLSGIVSPLVGHVDHWIAVTADSPRAIESGELARQVANLSGSACLAAESLSQALQQAQLLASPTDQILVTGSFYLVGPVLSELYSRP